MALTPGCINRVKSSMSTIGLQQRTVCVHGAAPRAPLRGATPVESSWFCVLPGRAPREETRPADADRRTTSYSLNVCHAKPCDNKGSPGACWCKRQSFATRALTPGKSSGSCTDVFTAFDCSALIATLLAPALELHALASRQAPARRALWGLLRKIYVQRCGTCLSVTTARLKAHLAQQH